MLLSLRESMRITPHSWELETREHIAHFETNARHHAMSIHERGVALAEEFIAPSDARENR